MNSRETFINEFLPLKDCLYRAAYHLMGSAEEAEDAVQDLYVKLWTARESLSEIVNPKAYCLTMLRNTCLDRLRSKRLSGRSSIEGVEMTQQLSDADALHGREQTEAVLKAVENLPQRERTVLKLKVLEDLSYKEIQERTGLPYLTLRVLLSTARKKLRKVLDDFDSISKTKS